MTDRYSTIQVDLDGTWVLRQYATGNAGDISLREDAVFASGFPRMRALFRETGIRATCFVNAVDLEDAAKRTLLRQLVDDGHEIASHGFDHQYLHLLTRDEKLQQLQRSAEAIEAFCGVRPQGFRAAGCAVDGEIPAALEQAGYRYDCSAFPTIVTPLLAVAERCLLGRSVRSPWFQPIVGCLGTYIPSRSNLYARGASTLVEMPVTTLPGLRLPLHFSYGVHLGAFYLRYGIELALGRIGVVNFVFHLADFADSPGRGATVPGLRVSVRRRLDLARLVVDLLQQRSQVVTAGRLFDLNARATAQA